jgi:ComF family protein
MLSARSVRAAARALALDLETLATPQACLGCERQLEQHETADACCAICKHRIRRIGPPLCERCGQPLDRWSWRLAADSSLQTRRRAVVGSGKPAGDTPHCDFCKDWPAELTWVRSAVWLEDGPARNLVHALKYGGWRIAARPMADILGAETGRRLHGLGALVAVPLGRTRQRERGHNQSALLASALGKATGLPVITGALLRTRETPTQTRLSPAQRWSNVSGAFGAGGERLDGMHVALVDDVVTTGATLGAAARALAELGPATIGAVTFARALVPA